MNAPPIPDPADPGENALGPTLTEVVIAGHRGDPATALAGLTESDPDVRAAALGALHRLDALDPMQLATSFDDVSAVVRRRAAEVAAAYRGLDLSPVLDDADPTVVEVAAWSCGEHEVVADHLLERLIRLASGAEDPIVRESAAAALGAIGDRRGLPAILIACRDRPAVRRRAVLALAPFLDDEPDGDPPDGRGSIGDRGAPDGPGTSDGPGQAEVEAALEAALTDRDWQVRQAAEDLMRARRGGVW